MRLILTVVLVLFSIALISTDVKAANPGVSATSCVSVVRTSDNFDNLIFNNQCGRDVFVVWCGDLKYGNKRCGDGPRDSFYTQSANIKASETKKTTLKQGGSYRYAACVGSTGFGSEGIEHPAASHGSYTCTSTGKN